MIRTLTGGAGIVVNGGNPANPQVDMKEPSAGMVRYNTDHLEFWDGATWKTMSFGDANIDLSPEAMVLLTWVREKIREEENSETTTVLSPEVIELLNWVKQKKMEEEFLEPESPITPEMEELFAWAREKKKEDDLVARRQQEMQAQKRKQEDLRRLQDEEEARKRKEEEARTGLLEAMFSEPVSVAVEPEVVVQSEVVQEPETKKTSKKKKTIKAEPVQVVIEKPKQKPPQERMW